MTPSSIKQMWADFDWKFWKADGMRKQEVDDENLDPHYRQMLKVRFAFSCFQLTNMNIFVIVPRCSQ
jgi:hypothetical protein